LVEITRQVRIGGTGLQLLAKMCARQPASAPVVRDDVSDRLTVNGQGDAFAAVAALRRQAVDPSYRDRSPRPMAELAEAAVRSGERELAGLALERLTETTRAAGTEWAAGIEARSRALLTEGAEAENLYQRRSNGWVARASVCSSPAPTCSTANGCGASAAAVRPATSCAAR
jgi:hypothetical protein